MNDRKVNEIKEDLELQIFQREIEKEQYKNTKSHEDAAYRDGIQQAII